MPFEASKLFKETANSDKRTALRDLSISFEELGKAAITEGLPTFILDVTYQLLRMRKDPTCPFHSSNDPMAGDYLERARRDAQEASLKHADKDQKASCTHALPERHAYMDSDAHVRNLHDQVYDLLTKLWDLADDIALWIELCIPPIEDANPTINEIQDKCLQSAYNTQRFVNNAKSNINSYASGRGGLAAMVLQWPGVVDYRISLLQQDQKECELQRQQLSDLRYRAITFLDVLSKNYKKIEPPSSAEKTNIW